MTITTADLKLLASARMTDNADSGGPMTGNVVQDGVENNVFPDHSTVDRARGAIEPRKLFAAVLSAGTDALLGAHVVMDETPADAAVSGLVVPSTGAAQTLADLVATMNAAGGAYPFRGACKLTAVALATVRALAVDNIYAPLIPKTVLSTSASGAVTGSTEGTGTVMGWEDSGQTAALSLIGLTLAPTTGIGQARLKPGSVTGTFTTASGAGTITSDLDGNVTLTAPAPFNTWVFSQVDGARAYIRSGGMPAVSAVSATAQVLVDVLLPKLTTRTPVVAGRTTYTIALPPGVVLNSLLLAFSVWESFLGAAPKLNGKVVTEENGKQSLPAYFGLNFGLLNRAAGTLTLIFQTALPVGTEIVAQYAAGGQTSPLAASALASSGAIASGAATVTIGGGLVFGGAAFSINGGGEAGLGVLGGVIRNLGGVVRGAVSDAGVFTLPGNDGRSITAWYGVQRNPAALVLSVDATLPTGLLPATLVVSGTRAVGGAFTATADAAGVFSTGVMSGTYNPATGLLQAAFTSSVSLPSLTYAASRQLPEGSTADLHGLVESNFPDDGKVQVIHAGDVAVLQHFAETSPATAVAAGTVNVGRTNLAAVRVIGADGFAINTGWTADLATGIVTWVTVTGWSQPVKVRHSIDHVAVVTSVSGTGGVTLNRAPERDFAVGSVLSSALLLDDLQAQCGAAFSQLTWVDVWSNSRIGDAIAAQYQQVAHPIIVSNLGAVTERWAIIFTSSTAFRVVGEALGQITAGTVNDTLAPINPVTGSPYFTIAATGWGAWAAGNVLRFPTIGANAPWWTFRVTLPSAPSAAADHITYALRGDIDR